MQVMDMEQCQLREKAGTTVHFWRYCAEIFGVEWQIELAVTTRKEMGKNSWFSGLWKLDVLTFNTIRLKKFSIFKNDIYNHKVFIFFSSPSVWCVLFFLAVAFHQKIWALHQTLIKREGVFLLKSVLVALIFLEETVEARRLAELHAQAIQFIFSMLVKTRFDPAKLWVTNKSSITPLVTCSGQL